MSIVFRIIWKLIISSLEAIGVFVVFGYVFSGFGLLFVLPCIGGILEKSSTSLTAICSIALTLIVCSWVVLIIRWFKRRIKEEKE